MKSAQIGTPVLPLYAEPDASSEVVSQALYGWQVSSLETHGHFQRVQTPDGYHGWAEAAQLISPAPENAVHKRLKIACNAAPVYPAPHVKNHPLYVLPFEVELPVLDEPEGEEARWIQVGLIDGRKGWIQRGHVSFDFHPLTLGEMLDLSSQFLGLPYIWGGVSSFGYDCSGFVQMLARQMGLLLPRDAAPQYLACSPLRDENPRAGDLWFYGGSATSIGHVALYLGHQRLLHAAVKPKPFVQEMSAEHPDLIDRFPYRAIRRLPTRSFQPSQISA